MAAGPLNRTRSSTTLVVYMVLASSVASAFAGKPGTLTKEQIACVWTLLEMNARSSADAGFLLYTLYREPGDDLLSQGWAKFGQGRQWLDWWLVLRPKPRRSLSGHDYHFFIEYCDESETKAVAEQPKILERIVHAHLYLQGLDDSGFHPRKEPIPFHEIKEAWLDWKDLAPLVSETSLETNSELGYYDSKARRVYYRCEHVNNLRQCYWLFGRGDEAKGVTNFTWKRDYLAFRTWIVENEPYLRFEKKECRFVLDQEAKKKGQTLPEYARAIPSPSAPFPDWKDSTPPVYDHDLNR